MTTTPAAFASAVRALAGDTRQRVLFVSHGWGGGVARHMHDVAALLADRCLVVWLDPGPAGCVRVRLSAADDAPAAWFALPAEMPALSGLLQAIGIARIHVHHLHRLPRALLDLPRALAVPCDVTLHDGYALCPRIATSPGVPGACEAGSSGACARCEKEYRSPWELPIPEWQAVFGRFLAQAARCIAPSEALAAQYRRRYPELAIHVWPHPEAFPPVPRYRRILLVGTLSPAKGLGVAADCAADARARGLPLFFRILGHATEPVARYPQVPLDIAGDYTEETLASRIAIERPDAILLPSLLPESYGYTLSAALAAGVPLVASSVGAYPERLARHPRHALLPPDAPACAWNDALLAATQEGAAADAARHVPAVVTGLPPAQYRDLYLAAFTPAGAPAAGTVASDYAPDSRHLIPPPVQDEPQRTLVELYRGGVESGDAALRAELLRQIREVDDERLARAQLGQPGDGAHYDALRRADEAEYALRLARARIEELEHSTSWRVTAPLRTVAGRWKVVAARLAAGAARMRHLRHQAGIAQTIARDQGIAALLRRVWRKLRREGRYRPPQLRRYEQETAVAPLDFPPPAGRPEVSIIVPTYGKPLLTYTCLKSLRANTSGHNYEVIVLDDAAPEPLTEGLPGLGGVRVFRNAGNLGFLETCNRGAELARGDVLVFLNNDTVVTPGWLGPLVDTLRRDPAIGLVGPKLVYPDGRLQEAGGIVWRDGSAWNCGRNEDPDRPEHNYVRETDYCSGACLAIPAPLFRALGGFDSRYAPAYYEDTDIAFAVRAAGRKVLYQPASVVVHFEGQTSGTDTGSGVKQYQLVNQGRFAAKWSAVLAAHRSNGDAPQLEHDRLARQRVLVIDACMLTPDQDSGSVRMRAILELFVLLRCKVSFAADNLEYRQPYVRELQQRGIEVLFHPYARSITSVLAERGPDLDLVILSRHYVARRHVDAVRSFAPRALVVFDTVDLHFLRAERLAALEGASAGGAAARGPRDDELTLVRKADATLVVSPVEQELLAELAPGSRVMLLSNIHELMAGGRAFGERKDLIFIGGFGHPPNVDGVLWYLNEVLPVLRERLPGVVTTIIGVDPPPAIRAAAAPDVVVAGHVPDVTPYFTRSRVSVSPLRYGAGVKGKVNLAMSYGLPVVATSPSIEGMHLVPGDDVLVADDATDFAEAIVRLYHDETLWNRIAEGGRRNIREHFSRDVARRTLEALLELAASRPGREEKRVRGA